MHNTLKSTFFIALLSANIISTIAQADPIEERVLWGSFPIQQPIYHNNGLLAWNGVRQSNTYNEANAFFHSNGIIAWDGMKRTRNTWGDASNNGIFYYDNGEQAWGGIPQKLNTWGDHHQEGIFYHPDGKELWCGVEQYMSTFGDTRNDAKFYHANGVKAWGGLKQYISTWGDKHEEGKVYYSNGKLAWSGLKKDPVYDSSGKVIATNVDYIWVHLGNNTWLYVDHEGKYDLSIKLGDGYLLHATSTGIFLELYGLIINL